MWYESWFTCCIPIFSDNPLVSSKPNVTQTRWVELTGKCELEFWVQKNTPLELKQLFSGEVKAGSLQKPNPNLSRDKSTVRIGILYTVGLRLNFYFSIRKNNARLSGFRCRLSVLMTPNFFLATSIRGFWSLDSVGRNNSCHQTCGTTYRFLRDWSWR